jgi:hypothetical protein
MDFDKKVARIMVKGNQLKSSAETFQEYHSARQAAPERASNTVDLCVMLLDLNNAHEPKRV